ncbi:MULTISPECIES: F0F1 ATP synthase subunit C [unclassified Sulfuricurvum]|jgi:F-type H+-transporting ATPase subunit c|uniref:F0F1 ATP synthase subunit C n=1 Tax=unclassified Sulfuricurvum TaxID=2632390 RepID=UPI0002996200|nr:MULTISPECIES: F0F1 ATP synthase subunit C [unclassified Sulfuricurvum]OHD85446.1 MAG: ATP synthase F0 subunit C [Sulfuricurvum sp. RIFCSPLOWO2_02_FULL_43_45]OHD86666.1 MAG: ATP synthase F0 subunit C [Sulfuricurvum sp. RIFCSPLOWO2_02_43_6]AFV96620.1 F0F1 ATP synthase subunit C [Candidatus Sulfuricurvum sp. RIFRC-1]OHD90080.1 MAG: ATP synthase F0 subunit C [Sulfuricurvum sp. RIFCSPLOWO2_12_FULL_43_24]HBM36071.1 ATP synthase F0 subunit C [Sulfuricurvum sp.]
MKKVLFLMLALVASVFGAEEAVAVVEAAVEAAPAAAAASADVANQTLKAYSMIAAGVGLGLAALGGAIGMGSTAAATIAGTARNPGLGGKLMTTMFIALAMIEAQVIYTLVIALIALYANPYLAA